MIQRIIVTSVLVMAFACTFAQTTFTKSYLVYTTNPADTTTVTITDYTYKSTKKALSIGETITYNNATYTITAIGPQAFTNNKVTDLTLPATLQEIGDSAFYCCSALTSVDASACINLVRIDKYAFFSCDMTTFDMSNCNSLITIADSAFMGCDKVTTITGLADLTSLDTIGARAFRGCEALSGTLTLPSSIEYIGPYAFYECLAITDIDLSACSNLTKIEDGTFSYCKADTLFTLPNTITSIGTYAFQYNAFSELDLSSLTKLSFVDNCAFSSCDSMRTIILPANLDSIGYYSSFGACRNIQTVYLTNTKAMVKIVVGNKAGSSIITTYQPFTINTALQKIYVPKHLRVTYIEDEQWNQYKDYFDPFVPGSAKASLEIDDKECYWGTYACDDPMDAPTNASYYDVKSINGSLLELQEVETTTIDDENILPAGAYLVCSDVYTSKLYSFDYTGSETVEAYESEFLKGCSAGDTVSADGYTYYIMSTRNSVPGFYYQNRSYWTGTELEGQAVGTGVVIDPYKAYLQVPTGLAESSGFSLTFAATDVDGIKSTQIPTRDTACYDLQGRRVVNPQKGCLYIRDGRKYIAE